MVPFLKSWGPALLWASFIFFLSSDHFSSSHTSQIIGPILSWLFPHATPESHESVHYFLRKMGHWSEYLILAILILRGFGAFVRPRWNWSWAAWTTLLILLYAFSDEFHQVWVPSRSADLRDSLIDLLGGICGVFLAYLWHPRPKTTLEL